MNKADRKTRRPNYNRTAKRQDGPIPVVRVRKGAGTKEMYAAAQRAFTAADLQRYTQTEQGIPARQILADLEAVDREEAAKRKRKSRNGRSR
jgi:hypothetical protein